MNILSTNCLSGHIYKDVLQQPYESPFVWCRIFPDSFIHLIDNWDNINFTKISMTTKDMTTFYTTIDKCVTIRWSHYLFHQSYSTPTQIGVNVYYNKIWEYIIEKYIDRLHRMRNLIDLVAVDDFYGNDDNSDYDLSKIIQICTKHKYKLFICSNRLPQANSDSLVIIPRATIHGGSPGPGDIASECGQTIKTLLQAQ